LEWLDSLQSFATLLSSGVGTQLGYDSVLNLLDPKIGIKGLLIAAGAVTTVASLAGHVDRFWWMFDLASHFRVQYFIVLTVIVLGLIATSAYRFAGIFAIMAMVNLAVIAPRYTGIDGDWATPSPGLRAMLLNIHTSNTDYDAVLRAIQNHDPDLVIIEEINQWWIKALKPLADRYPYSIARPRQDNFGIALLSKHPFGDTKILDLGHVGLPSILAQFHINQNNFFLLATHALPPINFNYAKRRNKHLSAIPQVVSNLNAPVLLLGDLNISPWSYHFKQLLRLSGLKDASKGRGIQATWPTNLWPMLIPIDHCLYCDAVKILDKVVAQDVGSDHYPIVVEFAF